MDTKRIVFADGYDADLVVIQGVEDSAITFRILDKTIGMLPKSYSDRLMCSLMGTDDKCLHV